MKGKTDAETNSFKQSECFAPHGTVNSGRQYLTTEAVCPFCAATADYAHSETHSSIGRWYGCSHLHACETDDSGAIVVIEFENF